MDEPVPPRHRRRERHRSRGAPREAPPAGAGGTPREYEPPPAAPPVQDPRGTGPGGGRAAVGTEENGPATAGEPVRAGGPATAGRTGRARAGRRSDAERGLRGIVGAGPSQVGVLGAMRARDAARPTAEDLAAAERDLLIVRRHYVPPDPDPRPDEPRATG